MIVIVGCLLVIGAVLGGFMMSGGHVHALIHPSELVTIGGASMGALIIMSSKKVLSDLLKAIIAAIKGSPFSKAMYQDLFMLSYDLLRAARRDGLLSLEKHLESPHDSSIFSKYPRISGNHHVMEFLCGGLSPVVEGLVAADQLEVILQTELRVLEEEHHAPINVLTKTADGLPGFGIVAAVLGIVITMGAIDGPVEEVGHKVGAALVGTFLGILLSYGFFGPMAARMELLGAQELSFFRTITNIILSFANDCSPKVAIEKARRSVGTDMRPNRAEMDELYKQAEAA